MTQTHSFNCLQFAYGQFYRWMHFSSCQLSHG